MKSSKLSQSPERADLSKFLDEVQKAPFLGPKDDDGIPYIEAPLEVIRYYMGAPQQMKGFEDTGYFIFHNVKVYEEGKRDFILQKQKEAEEIMRKRGQMS